MNTIENITPKDDAFHGIKRNLSLEWWYFDAVFEEGHSPHIGVKVISFRKFGIVRQLLDLYKGSNLIEKSSVKKYEPVLTFFKVREITA